MALLCSKLSSFDPKISYRSRTLDELNSFCNVINDCKYKLSNCLQYYLQKYKQLLDIPRLCRALAIPGELAEQFVEANKTKQYTDGLDVVTQSTNQIADILQSYFFYLHNDNGKNKLIASGAIIVRFKYVSNNKFLPPEEKVVSYHIMNFKGKDVLGVHVQEDQKFSMYKQWGHGDERLVPIYPEYENMIIRWKL
jgi:hypothetical protein